ncbi:DoxX family protein [Candidatus Woesearchaeota archaeon]|nr:DoxX family protein [Candidatus Woesearchaeota archaeon]
MGKCERYAQKYGANAYFVFRVLVGLLFLQHGVQKLFGMFGGVGSNGGTVQLMSLMGLAGVIETVVGIALVLGLFTRLLAGVAAVEMLVAFFKAHFSVGNWVPLLNKGELALLYVAVFLVVTVYGNGKWSLEEKLFKKEFF